MSELIDRSAIKLPPHFFEDVDNVPKFYEWLNSLPTASPWHRVEEKLPRYGDWVLCLGPKGGYYVSEFRGVSCLVGPRFHANGRFINATHWMPLPEPPKEDNNG